MSNPYSVSGESTNRSPHADELRSELGQFVNDVRARLENLSRLVAECQPSPPAVAELEKTCPATEPIPVDRAVTQTPNHDPAFPSHTAAAAGIRPESQAESQPEPNAPRVAAAADVSLNEPPVVDPGGMADATIAGPEQTGPIPAEAKHAGPGAADTRRSDQPAAIERPPAPTAGNQAEPTPPVAESTDRPPSTPPPVSPARTPTPPVPPRPDAAVAEETNVDPADRLQAIKARLAKQIENS